MNISGIPSDVWRCESGVSDCMSNRSSNDKQQGAGLTLGKQGRFEAVGCCAIADDAMLHVTEMNKMSGNYRPGSFSNVDEAK